VGAHRSAGARTRIRLERTMKQAGWFTRFANHASRATGHPSAFVVAVVIVAIWAITGPLFKFSDTWQLVINTGTTIITFLMVFLIQNTQNRDSAAIHLKLDELIRSHKQARNSMLDLEQGDEEILGKLRERYESLAAKARSEVGAVADEAQEDEGTTESSSVRAADRSR
jgi:low affinity Fe/Cu permease